MTSGEEQGKKRAKKGSGSIRKTQWGYEYRITYKDVFGKSHKKGFSGKTVDEVLERADDFREKLRKLEGGFDISATISEICRWKVESDYAKNYTGEAGYARNLDTISIIEKHDIATIPIVNITPAMVDAYMISLTSYSNAILRKIYSMIRMAFRIAFNYRIIDYNFMTRDDMRCPKSDKQDRKVHGFTEDEQAAFLKALLECNVPKNRNDYRTQLLISLYSGMRMGEINALKPENIDFTRGFVHVESTVSRGLENRVFIKQGAKTDAGVRDIPISEALEPVLRKALADMKENPEGLIFYDYNKNGLIETTQVNSFFHRLCEKAGLKCTGQHVLRHTFATRCIEAGISPLVLKTWLGHTNIHITLDTYADVFNRMNAGAISLLDRHIEEIGPVMLTDMNQQ